MGLKKSLLKSKSKVESNTEPCGTIQLEMEEDVFRQKVFKWNNIK